MKRKYGIFIIILLFLILGTGASIVSRFYSLDYLYNLLIKREFSINPKAEMLPEKTYMVRVWYQPFFRTTDEEGMEKEFFQRVLGDLHQRYPNIKLKVRELNFLNGREALMESLLEGNPPDIYFNLSNDGLIDPEYQISIEPYLTPEEKPGFYTVDWSKGDLWGWPLLVQEQCWIANEKILGIDEVGDFVTLINNLDQETLLLNYYDPVLLKQLLSLSGLDKLQIENGKLGENSYQALKEVFSWVFFLQEEQAFNMSVMNMDDSFLRGFFTDTPLIIGPVNPWLENFLMYKAEGRENYIRINIQNLVQVYTLSIFYQKEYLGDDHTRAVMETARVISRDHSKYLAEKIGLEPAYRNTDMDSIQYRKILEVTPEVQEYWKDIIIPAWLEFWEKGLTPEEVMAKFESE